MTIHWLILFVAVFTEIAWALSLKAIQVNASVWMMGTSGVLTVLNMVLLSFAMRGIPVGTAYGVWTGLGAVGITIAGVMVYGDPMTTKRIAFLSLIILGVVGLKFSGAES
jgi:quaternary ammonium compound-resistance protein SugE